MSKVAAASTATLPSVALKKINENCSATFVLLLL